MLSIVIPIYNEVENIPELHSELEGVLVALGRPFEILYVDDGSKDGSFGLLQELSEQHPEVVVIQFRRNFGQTAALAAGLEASRGDIVIFMDGDLQNDPAEIPRLVPDDGGGRLRRRQRLAQESPGRRDQPQAAVADRQLADLARSSGVQLHDYGCTLKAYRRDVLENVRLYGEMHRFIPAVRRLGRRDRHRASGQPPRAQVRHARSTASTARSRCCST